MKEKVEVCSIKENNMVEVKKIRAEACASCGSASVCGVKKEFKFNAGNPDKIDLKPGDNVVIEIPEISLTKISFIVYGIPTIVLIFSLLIFISIFRISEINSLFFSLIPLLLSIVVVILYDKKYKLRSGNKPRIIKIVK